MGFKCGIVGLPNVGKSTLFNALTQASVDASNYPFCTIEPNKGIVAMPDTRLDQLAAIVKPQKVVPTTMEFVDIAGLVAGASKGEGLGNQFLAHIREMHAIAQVVRCFEDENIAHVTGRIDPPADMETIHTELALADMETVDKALVKATKNAKGGDKQALAEQHLFGKLKVHLDAGEPIRTLKIEDEDQKAFRHLHLLTAKPTLYVANVAEDGFNGNPFVQQVETIAQKEQAEVVVISAEIEAEMAGLSDEEKRVFLEDMGLHEPGLNRLIRTGYHLLSLQTFFTAGEKEVKAWTIPIGATAPEAAGVIHTDFQKGFIRAEVISFDDFIQYNGEHGARAAGKLRIEGKDYIVQDGDVMHFRFNV